MPYGFKAPSISCILHAHSHTTFPVAVVWKHTSSEFHLLFVNLLSVVLRKSLEEDVPALLPPLCAKVWLRAARVCGKCARDELTLVCAEL